MPIGKRADRSRAVRPAAWAWPLTGGESGRATWPHDCGYTVTGAVMLVASRPAFFADFALEREYGLLVAVEISGVLTYRAPVEFGTTIGMSDDQDGVLVSRRRDHDRADCRARRKCYRGVPPASGACSASVRDPGYTASFRRSRHGDLVGFFEGLALCRAAAWRLAASCW